MGIVLEAGKRVSLAGSGTRMVVADTNGNLSTQTIPSVVSGTYTPTFTNENNVGSTVLAFVSYLRSGDRVFVTGNLLVTPTIAGMTSTIIMSLPVVSNVGTYDVGGTFSLSTGLTSGGVVTGNSISDAAYFTFVPSANTSGLLGFTFSYVIK